MYKLIGLSYKNKVILTNKKFVMNDDIKNKLELIAKFLTSEESRDAILLHGFIGAGKTLMANAICNVIDIINRRENNGLGNPVKKIKALEVGRLAINNLKEFEDLKKTKLLFIDDLGVEPTIIKTYGNEISPLTELIFERQEKKMFLILTSNLSIKGLTERYGDRFTDRINEYCCCIAFTNESFRK
jgi:DNA replication protein DnaC